ncbi:MAG: SpoIIE family protein phosphatase [Clostridia bacterium]|nr:SpoIIE family protein phosphatase [Clostridia bacterium]
MKESTNILNKTKESVKGNLIANRVFKITITAVMGFFLARTALLGQSVPFGLGFCAGLEGVYSFAAAIGSGAGYFFPITDQGGFGYVAAALAILAIKFVLQGKYEENRKHIFSAILGFASCLVATLPNIIASFSVEFLTIKCAECIICGCTAGAVSISVGYIKNRKPAHIPIGDNLCIITTVGLLLASLMWIEFGGVSLSSVCAGVIILCAAVGGQGAAGAYVGAILGFVTCVTGRAEPWIPAAMALSGLTAGLVSSFAHIGGAMLFSATGIVYTLLSGSTDLSLIYETVAAAIIFIFLPKEFRSKISGVFAPAAELPRLDGLKKSVSMRLSFASKALCDVSDTVENVAKKLEKIDNPPLEKVITSVEQSVCNGCSMRCYCWEERRENTVAALIGRVRGEKEANLTGCGRQDSLIAAAKKAYSEFLSRNEATGRIREIREALADQFSGVADLLAEVADEFDRERIFDHDAAGRVESALRSVDIIPSDVGCAVDRFGRMTVEIRVLSGDRARFSKMTIMREVSTACGREFEPPSIYSSGRGTLITLAQKARLTADVGLASITSGDGKLCGDTASVFCDGRGHSIMMISDGMGTGGRAAVDSAMVTGLMERMIKAGFGYDSALKIVNSALLFKSANESLATLDICSVDLFTGRAEFFKAGACPTLVMRSGRAGIAECASFPAGILRQVAFDTAAVTLSKGDIAVIFSDGVNSEGTDWIVDELKKFDVGYSAQQLAESLADSARRRRTDNHEDDITVAVTIIK